MARPRTQGPVGDTVRGQERHPLDRRSTDDYSLISRIETCRINVAKQPWASDHPPQNTGCAGGVQVGGTLGRCALARADQRRCAQADTREAEMGRRRQRFEPNGTPGSRCAQGDTALVHSARDAQAGGREAPQ